LGALLLAASGCAAALQANRRSPGIVAGDSFTVTLPPAASYGPGALTCPAGGLYQQVADSLADLAKRGNKPEIKGDGRLCAVAETLSGWSASNSPPESVTRQVAWHFGLPGPVPRVEIASFETGDISAISDRLLETLSHFAERAVAPRFGLQSEFSPSVARSREGVTKVVMVMLDDALDLDPVSRALPVGGQAKVSGRLPAGTSNATVLSCDPAGKLETVTQPGGAFAADLRCGERSGSMQVEIRAEKEGAIAVLARFPIACGREPSAGTKIPPGPSAGPLDAGAQERKLFQLLNAERVAGGIQALAWDDAVGRVARSASATLRATAAGGAPQFDLAAQLRQADAASALVLQNPVLANSAEEAHAVLVTSPVNRSNLLNPLVTHAGVGVTLVADPSGSQVYAVELLVREQGPVDTEALRAKLRGAVAQKRSSTGVSPVASDRVLEEVSQKYASELAAGGGSIAKERESEIVAPLYKGFRGLNLMSGAKPEPLDFAEERGAVGAGSVVGVGVAQGSSPALGKNAIYVVLVIGTRVVTR
jgi:uncharacterized protein YkwD